MHPAKEGFSALPFFDEFDLSTVDILLISQYVDCPFPSDILLSRRHPSMLHHTPEGRVGVDNSGPLLQSVESRCVSDTGAISMYMSHTIQYIPAVNPVFLVLYPDIGALAVEASDTLTS
jgi:hypothetical protein